MATGPSPVLPDYPAEGSICKSTTVALLDTYVCRFQLVSESFSTYSLDMPGDCVHRAVYGDLLEPGGHDGQANRLISDNIEVVPVVVLSQTFPARPVLHPRYPRLRQALPGPVPAVRRRQPRRGRDRGEALLEAAGSTGAINVSSVSSLIMSRSMSCAPALRSARRGPRRAGLAAQIPGCEHGSRRGRPGRVLRRARRELLRRDGLPTGWPPRCAARASPWRWPPPARGLGETVSRWVGGANEPRLRDLRRIRELLATSAALIWLPRCPA